MTGVLTVFAMDYGMQGESDVGFEGFVASFATDWLFQFYGLNDYLLWFVLPARRFSLCFSPVGTTTS